MDFKIGVLSDGFKLPPREALRKAADLGADGVQVYAVRDKVSPATPKEERLDFVRYVDSLGLKISALCGDTGRGFTNPDLNPETIQISKDIVDLAVDLNTRIVTTHIGKVPDDRANPTYDIMLEACREIADYAAKREVTFAVETGPEKAVLLKQFLDEVDSPGLGVNLDPANLYMCSADNPVAAVHTLAKYIVHTHAKDGIRLPELREDGRQKWLEVPLGEGGVPWPEYLAALQSIGYKSFLTIEREVGPDPAADISKAISFLKGFIG